jgi:quinate dehydrogenase (quinone)
LTEVREQPVTPGQIQGEQYSPTQPRSVDMPQIGAETLTEADMWGATPFDQLLCRIQFKSMRYEGLYTVPGTDKSLSFPGSLGGMNWGGLSVDPNSRYIFVNDMRLGLWCKCFRKPQRRPRRGRTPRRKSRSEKTRWLFMQGVRLRIRAWARFR